MAIVRWISTRYVFDNPTRCVTPNTMRNEYMAGMASSNCILVKTTLSVSNFMNDAITKNWFPRKLIPLVMDTFDICAINRMIISNGYFFRHP